MKKVIALRLVLMLTLPVAALGETLTAETPGFGGANNGWALTSAYVAGPIIAEYVGAAK